MLSSKEISGRQSTIDFYTVAYLNLGRVMCGGPIKEWSEDDLPALTAACVNPDFEPGSEGNNIPNFVPIADFSDRTPRNRLPGFSE